MGKHTHSHSEHTDPQGADEIISDLRGRGFRITKVRQAVVKTLWICEQPMSAQELLKELGQQDLAVNKTTVYRELDFLLENKVIAEIDILDGTKRYEIVPPDHHHHHLVCTSCGKIRCVEMDNDLDELESKIRRKYDFMVDSHVLEFFGRCSSCA